MSETAVCRHLTAPLCQGNGCDIGSGGDPVVPWAIQIDLPDEEFIRYGHAHDVTVPIQYRGDARSLPFKDATLDFVYSSHLIEDFDDWPVVLEEFCRVLKPGGNLVLMVPDHKLFREAVANGQGDNLGHKHEFCVGELTEWAVKRGGLSVVSDYLTKINSPKDYNILFVAKKKQPKKITVAITAYDRIDLLERCLLSLSKNDQSLFRVEVYPDLVEKSVREKIVDSILFVSSATGLDVNLMPMPEKRLYCCANIVRSIEGASASGSEYIAKLDSDIIVTSGFIDVMLSLSKSIGGGMAVSSIICHMTPREKQKHAGSVRDISLAGSNFLVSNNWWKKISKTAKPMTDRMKGKPNSDYDCNAEWAEMKSVASSCNPTHPGAIAGKQYFFKDDHNTASDAIIVLGAAVCDCPITSLVVNRCHHPSPIGVNTTTEFHANNYANTFLDEIDGDYTRSEFTRE